MPLLDGESGCVSEAGSSVDHVRWLGSGSVFGAFVKVDSEGLLGDDARKMLRFSAHCLVSPWIHALRPSTGLCTGTGLGAPLLRGSSREVDSLWR